jgi:hypothetical protein
MCRVFERHLSKQRDARPSEVTEQARQLGLMLRVGFRYWGFPLWCWGVEKMLEIRKEIMLQNLHRDRVISLRFRLETMIEQQARLKFRFKKAHITRLAGMITYAVDGEMYVSTHRRRYKVHIVEATCILFRRLATQCR